MQIFRKMRQCQSALEEEDVLDTLCRYNLLIDDFGVEKMTDFAFQTIYEIIDRRYEMGKGGLIITSNLDPDGLAHKFGCDRISSRIAEMCKVVKLEGKDRRIK